MIMTYVSEKINQRAYMGIFSQIWFLPCLIALILLPISTSNPWTTYAILTTLLSYPTPHPIQVGWCSRISNSTRTRTVSAALYNMFVQVQSIVSNNIYRQDDIPDYSKSTIRSPTHIFTDTYCDHREGEQRSRCNHCAQHLSLHCGEAVLYLAQQQQRKAVEAVVSGRASRLPRDYDYGREQEIGLPVRTLTYFRTIISRDVCVEVHI
jgi:hypothetical protein